MDKVARFKTIVGDLLTNMDQLQELLDSIATDTNCKELVSQLNVVDDQMVTVLEPLLLSARMESVQCKFTDLNLIDYVNRIDPHRKATSRAGVSWFDSIKTLGRISVDSVKVIRECLDYRLVNIADARRIGELTLEGKIL